MGWNDQRNIAAEATADQVRASIRDGEPIPGNLDIIAAAARTIRVEQLPEGIREAASAMLKDWADREGVDRPDGEGFTQ